jgi:uncharacterized protein (DUF2126 family)
VIGGGPFEDDIAAHDAAVTASGLDIWIGNEPTFTRRHSHAPEWVTAALGDEKHGLARNIVARLAGEQPGCVVLRPLGRQYPGEPLPRWSFGVYTRRDGAPLWSGPPDPLFVATSQAVDLGAFQLAIRAALDRQGFAAKAFRVGDDFRVAFSRDPNAAVAGPETDPRFGRPSAHRATTPPGGPRDELAGEGTFLLIVEGIAEPGGMAPGVELPMLGDVDLFAQVLASVAAAANACGLTSLVLRGHGPPVDSSVAYATVTPDPAVVEVNMAPHGTVAAFLRDNVRCYAAARAADLEPYRLHYNGAIADSGGGGQITFGGPSPARSPFFVVPQLLPRLIRYAQRHPCLSYLFAHDFVGPSGQSVRPDEHNIDATGELKLALALLDQAGAVDPPTLWRSLAPSLTDPVGNSHRAEINIEKLWNPFQPGRGQLGLVEFRAFRMQHTPARAAALAALVRAILAMLAARDPSAHLVDWGAALHDRFALPFYLEGDLRDVLADLEEAGLGLGPALRAELEADPCRSWSTVLFGGCALTIRKGLEFWSLIGDASQQLGTSRLVDASTNRVELALRAATPERAGELDAWSLRADDIELPMQREFDPSGPVRVFGVRYRAFSPAVGLHPTLRAHGPVRLLLSSSEQAQALEVVLHEWRHDGAPYIGLPVDLDEAAARRAARCVTTTLAAEGIGPPRPAPWGAFSAFSLDLRYG